MTAPVSVLLASLATTEEARNAVRAVHDGLYAKAHSEVAARRQGAINNEMRSIFRAVLTHCEKSLSTGVTPKPLQRPFATSTAPTLREMMDLLHDERAHFELTGSKDFEKAIASQLQWLMNEMTDARQQATTLGIQYNMLLTRYAKTEETFLKEKERARTVQGKYEEHVRASTSQQEQNDKVIAELNTQLQAMRVKMRQAALDVAASKLAIPAASSGKKGAGSKPVLAPLRTTIAASSSFLEPTGVSELVSGELSFSARVGNSQQHSLHHELSHIAPPESGRQLGAALPSHRSSHTHERSTNKSPADLSTRKSTPNSNVPHHLPPTHSGGESNPYAHDDDAANFYSTTILSLNQQMESLTARTQELETDLEETEKRLERQKESTQQAIQAGQLESKMIRTALGQVKEAHRNEIETLKKKIDERDAEIANQKKGTEQLHERLKESAAKMLSLQQLLLSGPSVQSLLVGAVQSEQVEQTAESIEDLSERISAFSSHFADITADDFGTALENQRSGPVPTTQPQRASRSRSKLWVAKATQTEDEGVDEQDRPTVDRKNTRSPMLDEGDLVCGEQIFTHIPTAGTTTNGESDAGGAEQTGDSASETPSTGNEDRRPTSPSQLQASTITVPPSLLSPSQINGEQHDEGSLSSPLGRKNKSLVSLKSPQSSSPSGKGGASGKRTAAGVVGAVKKGSSSSNLKGAAGKASKSGKGASPMSKSANVEGVPFVGDGDDGDDAADDDEETMSPEEYARREKEANARAISKARSSSFLSDGVTLMGEDAQREIANNMERQAALRKQLTQLLDQLEASRHETSEEKKAKLAALEELELERQRRSKDDERIQILKNAAKDDKNKIEALSLRVGQQLGENSRLIDELHGVRDARETDRENFEKEIADLRAKIAKLQESEAREAMLRKERQFVELCERAIRAMVSAEATASCPNCLTRLTNPVTLFPCGHNFCEVCFFEMQEDIKGPLSPDVGDAIGRWRKYRQDMEAHNRDPDQFKAPRQVAGFFTKAGYAKCVPNCPLYCSDCKARTANEYVTSFRLDELSEKIAYVSNVVSEIQALSMQRYCDEAGDSGAGAGRHFVMNDTSAMSTLSLGIDLEKPVSFYD